MHEIDLKDKNLRTDLIIETISNKNKVKGVEQKKKSYGKITVEETTINDEASNILGKPQGIYKTISFEDITDKDNYKQVEDIFIKTFKNMLKEENIKDTDTALIIGLGNKKSTPDALGPKTLDNILVTKHLFALGSVEKGYRETSIFLPGVTGSTGIETSNLIKAVTDTVKPDFVIVIDALSASNISRVNKTIQMSNTGITPGSGVGNHRMKIDKETLNIPVFALGVPTIVDAVTIATDTIFYMYKQFSFKMDNIDNDKLKLIPESYQNYLSYDKELSQEDKSKIFGMIGTLTFEQTRKLLYEVLSPINYNLMVTPKEVDFLIDKLSLLLGNGINKTLHKNIN